jgi:hypothetical protein
LLLTAEAGNSAKPLVGVIAFAAWLGRFLGGLYNPFVSGCLRLEGGSAVAGAWVWDSGFETSTIGFSIG